MPSPSTFSEARKEVVQRIDDFFEDKLPSKEKSGSFSIAGEEFTEIEYRKIVEYALFIKSSRT